MVPLEGMLELVSGRIRFDNEQQKKKINGGLISQKVYLFSRKPIWRHEIQGWSGGSTNWLASAGSYQLPAPPSVEYGF